jgi:hypothetical protein
LDKFCNRKKVEPLRKTPENPSVEVFHTEQLITELNDVVQRPKLAKYINQE